MFRPVKTKKVSDEIVAQIKCLIVGGKLSPGDRLPSERELSERLTVSRASVREALSALESMGVISVRPGEGSFVRQVSFEGMLEPLSFLLQMETDDIRQLMEVRKILEVETAALAAIRARPADIDALARALDAMTVEVNAGGIGDAADTAFHVAVAQAANNPVLVRVMNTIADLMATAFRNSRQKLFLMEAMPQLLYNSHQEIFRAIADHNPARARTRMRDHLKMVEEALVTLKHETVS